MHRAVMLCRGTMEPMRIALVSLHTSPAATPGSGDAGGMNVVVFEAARALARRGHEVVALTRATTNTPAGEHPLLPNAQDVSVIPPRLIALEVGPHELRKEELPDILPEFARHMQSLGPFDAVHAHYWLSGVAALDAFGALDLADAQAGRIVTTFHTLAAAKNARLAPGGTPEPHVRVKAEQRLAGQSFVVAGSGSELSDVVTFCGQPPRGSAIVHPGVDTELFHPAASAPSESDPAHPLRVTVLGRVQPLKGQDLAVHTFGEFARAHPELSRTCELVIAGEPTPGAEGYAAELRQIAGEWGVADRVTFLPAQTRVQAARLLASSAVVMDPSHSETFGLTALEAAACGVPVLAGGHTGLLESVPPGTAAIHITGRDPHEWAEALAALLTDDRRRAALGASAREHALTHNWDAHAASLERIYSRLSQ